LPNERQLAFEATAKREKEREGERKSDFEGKERTKDMNCV
jgi:hypothetical protein